MPFRFIAVLLALCLLLTGCNEKAVVDAIASQEQQTYAHRQFERLRARDFAGVEAALDPSLASPTLRATLQRMAAMIPPGEPRSVRFVGAQKHYKDGVTTLGTNIEVKFPEGWLLVQVVMAEQDGKRTVTGLNVYPRTQSLAEEHAFTLAGKGASHYIMLAAALASVALIVCALIVCVRTPGLRRKWLWIVFILLGFGKLSVNWSTGIVLLQPFSVQLFGASAMAPLGMPWMISVALPLGAIVFLVRADRRLGRGE